MQIAHEILSNTKAKKCLKMSLVAVVRSVRSEWDLSVDEVAHTLHLSDQIVRTWFKRDHTPEVSVLRDQDTQALLDFVDVYEAVSHAYDTKEAQREWLRTASAEWGNMTPLEFMMRDRQNVALLKSRFQNSIH